MCRGQSGEYCDGEVGGGRETAAQDCREVRFVSDSERSAANEGRTGRMVFGHRGLRGFFGGPALELCCECASLQECTWILSNRFK